MTVKSGNIFARLPTAGEFEASELLVEAGVTIKRIVSHGQASPDDVWYDQDEDEWVIVLAGSAGLVVEGEAQPRSLKAGDYVALPAHVRHRVAWTDAAQPTIWLAIHYGGAQASMARTAGPS